MERDVIADNLDLPVTHETLRKAAGQLSSSSLARIRRFPEPAPYCRLGAASASAAWKYNRVNRPSAS